MNPSKHPGRRTTTRPPTAGFTLLELLFVIVIIMILAALFLPAIARSKRQARQIECLSQLHQLGIAYLSFSHDHQDKLPFQVPRNEGGLSEVVASKQGQYFYRTFQALSNDLVSPRLVLCPSDDARTPAEKFSDLNNNNVDYAFFIWFTQNPPGGLLSGDGNMRLPYQSIDSPDLLQYDPNRGLTWPADRHEYRGNLLFMDGHVERTTSAQLVEAFSHSAIGLSAWMPPPLSTGTTPVASQGSGSSGSSGSGGGSAGGGSGGGAAPPGGGGFAVLQGYFQAKSKDGPTPQSDASPSSTVVPPVSPPPPRPPASDPPPAPPPPQPPPAPVVMVATPPRTNAPTAALTNTPPIEAVPAPQSEAAAPAPLSLLSVVTTPERCWYCWILIMLVAVVTGLLLGVEVWRRRRRTRSTDEEEEAVS